MTSALALSGCNPYQMVDSPSGDVQLLSAARACFDRGDFACASKYYGQVSSSSSDQAHSETAFLLLEQNGLSAGTFMNAVLAGGSSAGKLITHLAGTLTSTASESLRLAFFHAYQEQASIVDPKSQGLVLFITSISLLAEILAENATTAGTLKKSDLAQNATACLASTTPLLENGCGPRSGDKIITGTSEITLTSATDSQMSGSPSFRMIDATIKELLRGVNQMGSSSTLGSASSAFASGFSSSMISDAGPVTGSPLYRYTLLTLDIGAI